MAAERLPMVDVSEELLSVVLERDVRVVLKDNTSVNIDGRTIAYKHGEKERVGTVHEDTLAVMIKEWLREKGFTVKMVNTRTFSGRRNITLNLNTYDSWKEGLDERFEIDGTDESESRLVIRAGMWVLEEAL